MDDYMFESNVRRCKVAEESTTYLEIFSYSDPGLNTVEECALPTDKFQEFLYRRGDFAAVILPPGVVLIGALRLILQQNAKHPDALEPYVISLPADDYIEMVKAFHLSSQGIESTSFVGPFFWSLLDQEHENSHLKIIERQSFPRKNGYTRGWEVMLSYDFNTALTTGFCKGTPSSDIVECVRHLKASAHQICHPLLLPLIIHSFAASFRIDKKQREARDMLRKIEASLAMRREEVETDGSTEFRALDLDMLNTDLVQCKAQVLAIQYVAYLRIAKSLEKTSHTFWESLPEGRKDSRTKRLHASVLSRLDFYKEKWLGMETYASTTLQRLDIQKSLLDTITAQKESRLNFQIAGDQKKLAASSKRDSEAMKALSLLGSVFLPGTFIASIFSTTFFNFQSAQSISSAVSPSFWLYWVVTIPVTVLVICFWLKWEARKQRAYEVEDTKLEKGLEDIERAIMTSMRKRIKQ